MSRIPSDHGRRVSAGQLDKMSPEQRHLRAFIAANERWGRTPKSERTASGVRGQRGLLARFEREADPDGTLPADERAAQGLRLYLAHMSRITLARTRKKGGGAP